MSDYIKGQEDLIKYIKQQLLLMANNSPDETIMEDVVNFLQNLKPKQRSVATMENTETNWNELTLKERLALVKHNEQLDLYSVSGSCFAINAFVKCKNNGIIRYITEHNGRTFKDDGGISGCEPSLFCRYENYVMILKQNKDET